MIITEQKYALLNQDKFETIDWSKTYQTPDTVRWDINHTQFFISISIDSDYMPELNWMDAYHANQIASSDEFAGPRQSVQ